MRTLTSTTNRRWAWRAIGVAITATVLAGCAGTASPKPAGAVQHANLDFTLKDMNGTPLNLASLKGRPVLVNVWATYCEPCKLETPDLVAMYEKYKDTGFIVLGVSFSDTPRALKDFAAAYRISYPVLLGTDEMESAYETIGIPTSWFIRRDGTISETRVGIGSSEELERSIRALF